MFLKLLLYLLLYIIFSFINSTFRNELFYFSIPNLTVFAFCKSSVSLRAIKTMFQYTELL